MPNIVLTIAYDGSAFLGWQKTNMGPSVESRVEDALSKLLKTPVFLQAASRTDAGVHAACQIVNFISENPLDLKELKWHLNETLAPYIAVLKVHEAPLCFHPTLDCKGKQYRYRVDTNKVQYPHERFYSWHFPCTPDIHLMREAAGALTGTHDFQSFCNIRKNMTYEHYIRTISSIEIVEEPRHKFTFTLTGDNFLYKMVRNLVGTLIYVGIGKIAPEEIPKILAAKDRTKAGITAPAHGLTLMQVFYS